MADTVSLNKRIIQEAAQCLRLAYLRLRDRASVSGSISAADEIRLMYGNKVGQKAREQFPGGTLIEALDFGDAISKTQAALTTGASTLFEAAFSVQGVGIKVDILRRLKTYELIEVKSGTKPDEYFEDVAVQVWVLQKLGMKVQPFLMILDKTKTARSKSLFKLIDCSAEVKELLPEIEKRIELIRAMQQLPAVPFTRYCRDCDYLDECLPKLPRHNVFTLYRGGNLIDDLLASGFTSLEQIPKGTKLTDLQSIQLASVKTGKPWVAAGLVQKLKENLEYPLRYLDFEVAADPIPEYASQHPYDMLPFQWSCHIQQTPEAKLEHLEFLMDKAGDPRPAFAESLLKCLGDVGSIMVYTHYEKTAIKSLAESLTALRKRLLALLPRLFDLHALVKKNFYHPDFFGSFSIKAVLPALVSGLSYEQMAVKDGMEAVKAYYRLTSGDLRPVEHAALSKSLLEYCKLDTLAMVKVYESLADI